MSYRANDLSSKLTTPQLPEVSKKGAWAIIDGRGSMVDGRNRLSTIDYRLFVRSHTAFSAKAIASVVLQKDVRQCDVEFWTQEKLRTLPRTYVSALILMALLEQTPINSTRSIACLTTSRK